MERVITYIGETPQDTDVLSTNLNAYVGISKLAAAVLGTTTQLNGLACTQTATPGMSVSIAAGEIYQLLAIDSSGYGSLGTNSNQILKQGVNFSAITTSAMTAPVTTGQSVNYLIQFSLTEVDNGSQVLPYYNSANPSQAFSGPGNNSQPNNTNRSNQVGYQIKAGTPATTGTQTTPTPDSGYVGGYVVTIAYGSSTIVNANISVYPGAPFLLTGGIPINLQNNAYFYAVDTSSSANTITASLNPPLKAYVEGQKFQIKIANTNTGASTINLNGLGAKNITFENARALAGGEMVAGGIADVMFDGTQFQLINLPPSKTQNDSLNFASSSSSANTYILTMAPAPTAYVTGMRLSVLFTNANTGASTLNVNSLGSKSLKRQDLTALQQGDIGAGSLLDIRYDGTQFQILSILNVIRSIKRQYITSSGGYTPSPGMVFSDVIGVGAAAGGGGTTAAGGSGVGGGGGAGGYFKKLLTAPQVTSAAVVIGAAGTAGSSSGGNGGSGSATTFTCTGTGSIVLTANGGTGGGFTASQGAVATAIGGAGGTATGGDINIPGQSGSNGFALQALGVAVSGLGGTPGGGLGVGGGTTGGATGTSSAGNAGSGFGAGGSGAYVCNGTASVAGGAGKAGYVELTEYCTV